MSANSFSAAAAEFPHDNPELFAGPGWLAVEPCAPPRAVAPASSETLFYPKSGAVKSLATDADVGRATVQEGCDGSGADDVPVAPSKKTDLERFVACVVEVLRADGAEAAAEELERFLQGGPFAIERLPEQSRRALVVARFAPDSSGSLSEATCQTRDAWRLVLRGEGTGLTDLCESTLDEWASGLVAACLGVDPSRNAVFRRRLRAEGVAAFGMLVPR